MADPTALVVAHKNYIEDINRITRVIKTAEALKKWALVAHDLSTGKLEFGDDAAGLLPVGILIAPADGNADHLTGNGVYKAVARGGIKLSEVTVTGVSALTDIYSPVYCTDGQTMTLTYNDSLPIGYISNWTSGTTCDVYLFSGKDTMLMSMPPSGKREVIDFGVFSTNTLQGNAAANLLTLPQYKHYNFISFHGQCCGYDNALIAGAQTLNIEIAGVDVTGGALTLGFANADAVADQGVAINAAVITGTNEVHIGDTLQIEMAAGGTGFTADVIAAFRLYAVVDILPGA